LHALNESLVAEVFDGVVMKIEGVLGTTRNVPTAASVRLSAENGRTNSADDCLGIPITDNGF
jgi:hypothetical protein